MVSTNSLEKKKRELLLNLSFADLKQYILLITNNYYKAFAENDVKEFNHNLYLIKEIIELYKDKYANITGFVYYNLTLHSNNLLNENSTIKLENCFKYDLQESNEIEEELNHDIKEIFNIDRIKARYNEKQNNKVVE